MIPLPFKNPEDKKAYNLKWRTKNKERYNAQQAKYKRQKRQWFRRFKATLSCNRCPENAPECLDFHHEGDKEHTINHMIKNNHSKENIMKEIGKCEVLCANCHRKHHEKERKRKKV